jgi:hypothetical protein
VNQSEIEQIFVDNIYHIKGKVLVALSVSLESHSAEEITLLTKILGSAKLSIEGVQIICKEDTTIHEIKNYDPSIVILFGVTLTPAINTYSPETLEGITIISADSLSNLNDTKKKSLWAAIKQGFNL